MQVGKNKALRHAAAMAGLVLAGTGAARAVAMRKEASKGTSTKPNPQPTAVATPTPVPSPMQLPTSTPVPTPTTQVTSIVFSEGGSVFMTGDSSGTVQVREARAGDLRRSWSVGAAVRGIDAVAGSRRVLIDTATKLSQWDIPSGALVGESDADPANGPLQAETGSRFYGRFTAPNGHPDGGHSDGANPDGASTSGEGIVLTNFVFGDTYSFDIAGGSCYALSPSARVLAVGCAGPQGGITFFDMFNRRLLLTCQDAGLTSGVVTLTFLPEGRSVMSVQSDGSVLETSVETGASNDLHLGAARPGWVVTGAQFNSDQDTVAIAARKTTSGVSLGAGVRVFELRTGRLISKVPGVLTAFALSPDGGRLVVAFRDGTTGLFDTASGARLATWGIAPAPAPRLLLTGLELPDELQLLLERSELGVETTSRYDLRRSGDQFQVAADVENRTPGTPATSHTTATVPASLVDKFLAGLSAAPCAPGRYTPLIEQTDSRVHVVIVFHSAVRSFSLYTDSQGVEGMPWGLTKDGSDYTVNSTLPGQALDAMLPALQSGGSASVSPK